MARERGPVPVPHRPAQDSTAPGWADQVLYVPTGSTDAQVLEWASQCFDEVSLAELREVLERERP